jgi:WD40 repeat protein
MCGPKASLNVRVANLHIRALFIPNMPGPAPRQAWSKGWLVVGLILGLMITFVFTLGVWHYVRQVCGAGEMPTHALGTNKSGVVAAYPRLSWKKGGSGRLIALLIPVLCFTWYFLPRLPNNMDFADQLVWELISATFSTLGNPQDEDGEPNADPRVFGVQARGVKRPLSGEKVNDPSVIIRHDHFPEVSCGNLTPDGRTLVTIGVNGIIKFWDVGSNQERRSLPALGHSAARIASALGQAANPHTLLQVCWTAGTRPRLKAAAVSPSGKTVAVASTDQEIRILDIETGHLLGELRGHTLQITGLAYSPDGQTLASAAGDRLGAGQLKLWNMATGKERVPIEPFKQRLRALSFAPDGNTLAVASGDNTAQIVDMHSGKVLASFGQPSYAHSVAFSPDGKRLAVASGPKGYVRIHELNGCKQQQGFQAPSGYSVGHLEFSRDGKGLLAPCIDGTVVIWDVSKPEAQVVATLTGHHGNVRFAVFFPDGQTVASADDREILLWRVSCDPAVESRPHEAIASR